MVLLASPRPPEGLGADLSTLILPTNLGGWEGGNYSPGCVFVIVDKADVISN